MALNQSYLFLDLETTGLEPHLDSVLEIGCFLVTPAVSISPIWEYSAVFQYDRKDKGHEINPYVLEMHESNGLWDQCEKSKISVQRGMTDVIRGLKKHGVDLGNRVHLAGNSVHFDRSFLQLHMPDLLPYLTHRHLDITTLHILRKDWSPEITSPVPHTGTAHRSLDDAYYSYNCLIHYLAQFSKQND